ncbi:Polyisoprenoid-binding protein YceI [Marinobacter daqiaonensis]|uniref:Polyisoprenoid-binding protein YceI n=1 Tax=Marinobacter daqiaonensis TaxID=650891 RepID=A0A1I6H0C0_9GAMM|nr:YceI family protein [Marinobacter daqiaonensis]SFR47916.1 Polyisoprenoid-binding protein YceI [Marinobacter daqiaonensis]
MNKQRKTPYTLMTGLLAAVVALASPAALAEVESYKIDDEHFSLTFEVNHLGYASVIGMFLEARGEFDYDAEARDVPSGKVVVQSESVFSNHEKRDEHLRKDDFLHASKYPEITFEVTDFEATGDNTGNLTGDLTLLGKTRPVTLDVTLNKAAEYPIGHEEYTLGISASTTIKRSDWGMTYALDPLLVGDEVYLRFEFEAIQQNGGFF